MTELQNRLLQMLKWFHGFCTENNLRYYAIAGTALGAVRHGGFIPWDDDLDVGMPRPDYERFKELTLNKVFLDKYVCEFPIATENYFYPIGKVFDITTTLIENRRGKPKKGIFLDVFPMDGLGDDKSDAIKHFKKVDMLFNKFNMKVCAVSKERKWYKNMAVVIMKLVPDFIVSPKRILKKLEVKTKEREYDTSKYVCNFFGAYHKKEIMEKDIFGTPKTATFEDFYINLPQDVDKHLTNLYGDYMTPPPVEKQKTHHSFLYLDLNKGYLDK